MDPDELNPAGEGASGDDGDDAGAASTPASTALTPDAIRNSPEYRALMKENRKLARQAGSANAAATAARTAAEEARLAAEAQQQAVVDAQITAALGPEGVTFWQEFAELSATDPVAAAQRLAEFRAAGAAAQSAADGADPADANPAAGEGTAMSASTPPPPAAGVEGGAPLGAAGRTQPTAADVAAGLEKTFTDMVERVQDPLTRNRVTMKDRASAMISYLGAAYVRATGNEPRDARAPR